MFDISHLAWRDVTCILFDGYNNRLKYASLTGTSLFGSGAADSSQIVEITDLVIRDSSNNEYSCSSISRSTYLNYTVKTTSGRPTQYYFEKTINNIENVKKFV